MGYYCTVPQCTSLAGKTKNVKFHRFPRDVAMADKWNVILKRGKPYTKYSKVCSLHFTQQDYNVTTMGQWKTLSKDAVPSQNLPRCNPDGTPMVIRKSRTVKCKQGHIKKEMDLVCDKTEDKWPHTSAAILHGMATAMNDPAVSALHSSAIHETALVYNRIQQSLTNLAQQHSQHQSTSSSSTSSLNNSGPNHHNGDRGIEKADATQQTEPRSDAEEYDSIEPFSGQGTSNQFQKNTPTYNRRDYEIPKDYTQKNAEEFMKNPDYNKSTDFSKTSNEYPSKSSSEYEKSASPDFGKEAPGFGKEAPGFGKEAASFSKGAPDYSKGGQDFGGSKNDDFLPQTNEEYNKEAEKYALERKSHFDKLDSGYHKSFPTYPKLQDVYPEYNRDYAHSSEKTTDYPRYHDYQNGFPDAAGHNLALLHEQHRLGENPGFFGEPHIKQEIDLSGDDDKYLYERSKEALEASSMYEQQRLMQQRLLDHVKTEPDANSGCDGVMQAQSTSPYYQNGHNNIPGGYYQQYARQPLGPELLIAKQNALAAHTQLWQNTMKRPFFYSESPHYNGSPILQRYEDLTRISQ